MELTDALKWADANSRPEAVKRLKSRQVAKTLAGYVRLYADALRQIAEHHEAQRIALDECGDADQARYHEERRDFVMHFRIKNESATANKT